MNISTTYSTSSIDDPSTHLIDQTCLFNQSTSDDKRAEIFGDIFKIVAGYSDEELYKRFKEALNIVFDRKWKDLSEYFSDEIKQDFEKYRVKYLDAQMECIVDHLKNPNLDKAVEKLRKIQMEYLPMEYSIHKKLSAYYIKKHLPISLLDQLDPPSPSLPDQQFLRVQKLRKKIEINKRSKKITEFKNFYFELQKKFFGNQASLISKADQMMDELIKQEEKEKAAQLKTPNKKNIKNSKNNFKNSKQKQVNLSIQESHKATLPKDPVFIKQSKVAYLLELQKRKIPFKLLPRITRWKTEDLHEIRQFKDTDDEGKQVFKYANYSDDEIIQQRSQHYLPGIEQIIADPTDQLIYSFKTNRGYGLLTELFINDFCEYGIVYLGVSAEKIIFHKYWHQIDIKNFTVINEIFLDKKEKMEADLLFKEEEVSISKWTMTSDYIFEIDETNVITIKYSEDHCIRIYPYKQ